jgi:hypothetical protein
VVHLDHCNFIELKWNFGVAANRNNAPFTGDDLVKTSAVFELHRDNLIPESGLSLLLEVAGGFRRNTNQTLHLLPPVVQGLGYLCGILDYGISKRAEHNGLVRRREDGKQTVRQRTDLHSDPLVR